MSNEDALMINVDIFMSTNFDECEGNEAGKEYILNLGRDVNEADYVVYLTNTEGKLFYYEAFECINEAFTAYGNRLNRYMMDIVKQY